MLRGLKLSALPGAVGAHEPQGFRATGAGGIPFCCRRSLWCQNESRLKEGHLPPQGTVYDTLTQARRVWAWPMMMAVGMERTGCPRDAGAREGAERSGPVGVGGEISCSGLMMPPASSTP